MYLRYWIGQSGLVELLPTLPNIVYVGVSAGSIITTTLFNCDAESNLQFAPEGSEMTKVSESALGLVDFTMWVHVDNPNPIFEDHTMANVEKWARGVHRADVRDRRPDRHRGGRHHSGSRLRGTLATVHPKGLSAVPS